MRIVRPLGSPSPAAVALLAATALASGVPVAAQCAACSDRGLVACPDCGHAELDRERRILASVAPERCRTCDGIGQVPCPESCAPPEGYRTAWAAQRDRWSARLAAAGIPDPTAWRWLRVRHLDLAFSIDARSIRSKPRVPSVPHALAVALDAIGDRWHAAVLGVAPNDGARDEVPTRPTIGLVGDRVDLDRLCRAWVGSAPGPLGARPGEGSESGPALTAVLWHVDEAHPDLGDVGRLLAHHASHLWLHRRLAAAPEVPAALDAGLAHWTAAQWSGEGPGHAACRDFCHGHGAQLPREVWGGDLGIAARERLEGAGLEPIATLLAKPPRAFDLDDHAVAFALVDWLVDPSAGGAAVTGVDAAAPRTATALAGWIEALAACGDAEQARSVAPLARALGRAEDSLDGALAERIRSRFPRAADAEKR